MLWAKKGALCYRHCDSLSACLNQKVIDNNISDHDNQEDRQTVERGDKSQEGQAGSEEHAPSCQEGTGIPHKVL